MFDLLHLDGRSLLDEPLQARRRLLEGLGSSSRSCSRGLEEATDPAAISIGSSPTPASGATKA